MKLLYIIVIIVVIIHSFLLHTVTFSTKLSI